MVKARFDLLIERKTSRTDNFEKILKMESIDYCNALAKDSLHQAIPMIRDAIEYITKFENLYDICTGASNYIKMLNVTWDGLKYMDILPKDEYKIHLTWADDLDDRAFYFRMFGNILK